MVIAKPYAKIVHFDTFYNETSSASPLAAEFTKKHGIALLRKIEWCGRISHRSEEKMTDISYRRFIQAVVLDHGDWSIVEHATVTTDWDVDRGVQQEHTRHRPASYTIESTRFVNYAKGEPARFIEPPEFKSEASRLLWTATMQRAEDGYLELLSMGEAPQIARDAFPLALAGRIITTSNLRMWRHLLLMRTTRETHPKFRHVSIPLLAEFQQKIPILFDDIVPMARQKDNMEKVDVLWAETPQE
jgi:thymidylate synthase (FAD)